MEEGEGEDGDGGDGGRVTSVFVIKPHYQGRSVWLKLCLDLLEHLFPWWWV